MSSGDQVVAKNQYNRMEFAGALGDLGTFIPYVLVYITILKFDPASILLAFGIANVITGLIYRTPIPVQPMKAIGTFAMANASIVNAGMIYGAGLATGLFWLVIGLSGMGRYLAEIIKKPVAKGIVLGLGLLFLKQGLAMAWQGPLVAGTGLLIFFGLKDRHKIPGLLVILIFGVVTTLWNKPDTVTQLLSIKPVWRLPVFHWQFSLQELMSGILILALPQVPITFANGILAVSNENNELFPDRAVTIKKLTLSTALMNLVSPWLGGIPMCHGAGGLAGHVRFGARTGGATVILGVVLIILGLFFSNSVLMLFSLLPTAVLGVIMTIAGGELVRSSRDKQFDVLELLVYMVTAGIAFWNAGYAVLVGLVLSKILLKDQTVNNQTM